MKSSKCLRMRRMYLAGLCLLSALLLMTAGSATAASLLFRPATGFPYIFVGSVGVVKIETVGRSAVVATGGHYSVRVLSATTADGQALFLGIKSNGEPCGNAPNARSGDILVNLFAHLGLAHPGDVPAILLLIPNGFEFKCLILGGLAEVPLQMRGSIIGHIVSPAVGVESENLLLSFMQSRGVQEFTTFLKGNQILTSQFGELSIDDSSFEQVAEEGHGVLRGSTAFLLISP